MQKTFILTVYLYFILICYVDAKAIKGNLTAQELQRVKVFKEILVEVETKSFQQLVSELEKSLHLEVSLAIKEAMAQTYEDIVREQNVEGLRKKEWLYSMVALNMAYFQFGGDKDSTGGAKNLNKLIRQKLKTYLPSDIFNKPGFHSDLG